MQECVQTIPWPITALPAFISALQIADAARHRRIPLSVVEIDDDDIGDLYDCDLALIRPDHYVASPLPRMTEWIN